MAAKPRSEKSKPAKPAVSFKPDYLKIAEEFVSKAKIPASISLLPETDDVIGFQLEPSDESEPGILIGYHGETLASIERLLGLIIEKKTGSWKKVTINIGDYKERREETLKNLALTAAQRVRFSGQPWPLPPLSAAERRLVHLALSENPDVITESEGEGPSRRIVVKPRSK